MKYAQAQELEEFHNEAEEMTALDFGIAGGVTLIVLVAMIMVWKMNGQFGGKLETALTLFVIGIIINLTTALWTFFAPHRLVIGDYSFDNHNLFMAIATLFFLASIHKFTRLIPREA